MKFYLLYDCEFTLSFQFVRSAVGVGCYLVPASLSSSLRSRFCPVVYREHLGKQLDMRLQRAAEQCNSVGLWLAHSEKEASSAGQGTADMPSQQTVRV